MDQEINIKPLVSVIVLFYNHENFVFDALNGIFRQTYKNFEVIIRDDGSKDDTRNVIKDYLQKNPPKVKVKLLLDETNIGLMKGLNKCLEISEGKYITHCGGDDISYPERVEKAVFLFLKYKVDLVASNAMIVNKENLPIQNFHQNIRQFHSLGKVENDCIIIQNLIPRKTLLIGFGGFSLSYRREILNKFDGFFPLIITFEDVFLSFLANLNGGIAYYTKNLVSYRRHENNWYISPQLSYTKKTNEYKLKNAKDIISALKGYIEILNVGAYYTLYEKSKKILYRRIEKKIFFKNIEIEILLNNKLSFLRKLELAFGLIWNPFYPKQILRTLLYLFFPKYLKNR